MGDRSSKHARIPPTREMWFQASRGTSQGGASLHNGYDIDADTDYAEIEVMVPHDYHGLVQATLVFFPLITNAAMTFNVHSEYCARHELMNLNTLGPFEKTVATVTQCRQQVNINDILLGGAGVRPIAAGDMVGVRVERVAGQNTDGIFLGIRFRYKVFKFK